MYFSGINKKKEKVYLSALFFRITIEIELMTRTNNNNNNNSEHSSSRRSSSSLSTIPQQTASTSSSLLNESKDIINQNELTIQKLLLELQDDLKKTKEYHNISRDGWLSIQQQQQNSLNENTNSQSIRTNLTQSLTNVQNEMDMYRTALKKIA
jgi:hypothetical protein